MCLLDPYDQEYRICPVSLRKNYSKFHRTTVTTQLTCTIYGVVTRGKLSYVSCVCLCIHVGHRDTLLTTFRLCVCVCIHTLFTQTVMAQSWHAWSTAAAVHVSCFK